MKVCFVLFFAAFVVVIGIANAQIPPQVCPINEYWTECLPPCPATCAEMVPPPCNNVQCTAGCACNVGYVHATNRGQCILPNQCPPMSPGNPIA